MAAEFGGEGPDGAAPGGEGIDGEIGEFPRIEGPPRALMRVVGDGLGPSAEFAPERARDALDAGAGAGVARVREV